MKNGNIKKVSSWEKIIKNFNCDKCGGDFSLKDIQDKKYQVVYGDCRGAKEIYNVIHSACIDTQFGSPCGTCGKKTFSTFIINNEVNGYFYHPECWEKKEIFYKKHTHPRILKLEINFPQITVFLDDGREIKAPLLEWLKKWGYENVKFEQLTKYEIENNGERVYFPDINEIIPVRYFSEGLEANCCC